MRILAVNYTKSLLMEGIEIFLMANGEGMFDVISTTTDNIVDLVQEIEQLKPNTIIIERTLSNVNPADLFSALLKTDNMRLIVVNLNNNKLDIYDKSNYTILSPEQFIETLVYRDLYSTILRR